MSGPGHTKEEFVNGKWLEYRLKQSIIGMLDASYAGSDGVREAFEKTDDLLEGKKLANDKKLVDMVMASISTGLAAYGTDDSERALVDGSAHTVVLADSVELTRLKSKCPCGHATVENVPANESVRRQSEMERSTSEVENVPLSHTLQIIF